MAERVLAMMSGGVDSSVCAALLVERGLDVVGVTMKLSPLHDPVEGRCCTVRDASDARRVAHALGIPHYTLDLVSEFSRAVVEPFREAYAGGRTPIPCLPCNHAIKFGAMLERARDLGCSRVATGHYVRLEREEDALAVRRGRDREKDQSYFLCRVPLPAFETCLFPLGDLTKDEVRRRAAALGLVTADKPESQEICFVGREGYRGFLQRAPQAGEIVDRAGNVLGRHEGYWNFTIGQRRGIGVAYSAPLYVVDLDPPRNRVVVGLRNELQSPAVRATALNLLAPLASGDRVEAQIRHRHTAAPATVAALADDTIQLVFDEPQDAVTPGQALALYRGDRLLGGAEIDRPVTEPA